METSKSPEKVIRAEEGGGAIDVAKLVIPSLDDYQAGRRKFVEAAAIPEPVVAPFPNKRDCPKCGQPQFMNPALKEWQHSTGSHAYDCKLLSVAPKPTSSAKQFRKKPVVIEAMLWTGSNLDELKSWGAPATILPATSGESLIIGTLEDGPNSEAVHVASLNDWIIKGVKGEFYPCKPDVFEITYSASPSTPVSGGQETIGLGFTPCRVENNAPHLISFHGSNDGKTLVINPKAVSVGGEDARKQGRMDALRVAVNYQHNNQEPLTYEGGIWSNAVTGLITELKELAEASDVKTK